MPKPVYLNPHSIMNVTDKLTSELESVWVNRLRTSEPEGVYKVDSL